MARFTCPRCDKELTGDSSDLGRMVVCPDCDCTFRVPLPKSKRRRSGNSSGNWIFVISLIALGFIWLLCGGLGFMAKELVLGAAMAGVIGFGAGWIWIIRLADKDGMGWHIRLIPFMMIFYTLTNLERTFRPALLLVVGLLMLLSSLGIAGVSNRIHGTESSVAGRASTPQDTRPSPTSTPQDRLPPPSSTPQDRRSSPSSTPQNNSSDKSQPSKPPDQSSGFRGLNMSYLLVGWKGEPGEADRVRSELAAVNAVDPASIKIVNGKVTFFMTGRDIRPFETIFMKLGFKIGDSKASPANEP